MKFERPQQNSVKSGRKKKKKAQQILLKYKDFFTKWFGFGKKKAFYCSFLNKTFKMFRQMVKPKEVFGVIDGNFDL